jgi:hypothetical protein
MTARPTALLPLLLTLATPALADWPAHVVPVKAEKGKRVEVKAKLEDGKPIEDLSWASNSSVACFPATQNAKYRGPHVLFRSELPPRSVMTITVTPDDPKTNLSLYAYSIGATSERVVPDLPSCVSCESDEKWDRPKKNRTQDHTRSVKLNAIANPYNVVIGVSGPAGEVGGFTVAVELQ